VPDVCHEQRTTDRGPALKLNGANRAWQILGADYGLGSEFTSPRRPPAPSRTSGRTENNPAADAWEVAPARSFDTENPVRRASSETPKITRNDALFRDLISSSIVFWSTRRPDDGLGPIGRA
jgi:hypothetical protein